ncbi:hypothetical protein EDB85DRAFT_708152 [Lactarius pseudohatsudake]|nr:hypothetical protein EDB85DRAFT_708152 [Lactarius pseudohatsudake]
MSQLGQCSPVGVRRRRAKNHVTTSVTSRRVRNAGKPLRRIFNWDFPHSHIMRPTFSVILFFLPLVSAITFQVPNNLTSGGSATISWSSSDTDPDVFTIELVNTNLFHNAIAIANNVQKTAGSITVTLPIVQEGDGYTIEAVDIGNINNVFGTSGDFAIGATVTTTSSTSTPTSVLTSSSCVLSLRFFSHLITYGSQKRTGSVTSPRGSTSTSGFGITVTSTKSSVSSGSSSGTSSSASPSSFNGNGNGALGSNIGGGIGGSIAAAVVGVIAGAVFI